MSAKDENITTGFDRLNALFAWWGVPGANGNDQIVGQLKRFQALTSDLQKAYGEAYSDQMGTLLGANERIAGSLQEFLRCRQPLDVIAAQSNVLATILEEVSLQAKTWSDLTQKVQDCCSAMAGDAAGGIRKQAKEEVETRTKARPAQWPERNTGKHAAHA